MVRYHQVEQNKTLSNTNRIIALYGHAECGKSRTMNILRELIRENGKSMKTTTFVLIDWFIEPQFNTDRCF